MTAHPEDVNKATLLIAERTAGKDTLQIVKPIHTPRAVARAFPPQKPRNSEKTCQKMVGLQSWT